MGRCFVMQPFDDGPFDKRYDDVFEPAIKDADLEPYRVDRDHSVSIPIDEIENGIRRSELCLAEITTDNPNVWFELGYAIGVKKEVILVCSDERKTRFPFDVQHRNIIKYVTESQQDFQRLRLQIKERILAIREKIRAIDTTSQISPVAETEGLSQHEMVALVSIMQNSFMSGGTVSAWTIQQDMNSAGFTAIAIGISLKSLLKKGMILSDIEHDRDGEPYSIYKMNSKGEDWLLNNQDKLILKNEKQDIPFPTLSPEDEIPF